MTIRIHSWALIYLTGRALELQHFRQNPDCGVLEELEPIVFNPTYDFDFQQFLYLPHEFTILPVGLYHILGKLLTLLYLF